MSKPIFALALAGIALTAAGLSPALSGTVPAPLQFAATPSLLPRGEISVLSYNVKGLPWPLAAGRPAALEAIGDELAEMHARGTAPQVVVLQEAFTRDAQAIARRAGYRYAAFGPDSDSARPAAPNPTSGRADPDYFRGEGLGAFLPSGLIIMSDYRLSDVRRLAFPQGACSGYDCLANKGMLSAHIAVPGVPDPVEIVTTHMNSGGPSGQPEAASRAAYAEELAALGDFASASERRRTIRIYAGDFNVGHSRGRLALLAGYIRNKRAKVATAQGRAKYAAPCARAPHLCSAGLALAANVPLTDANDWQFYSAPEDVQLLPVAREAMFRPDGTGRQLSDHLGLKVTYRFH